MTCAKQIVTATLIALNGREFVGTNACETPQKECPRDTAGYASGEGYHLCKSICGQGAHAEVNAINAAGDNAKGSTILLRGHTYACDSCKSAARLSGVKLIEVIEE